MPSGMLRYVKPCQGFHVPLLNVKLNGRTIISKKSFIWPFSLNMKWAYCNNFAYFVQYLSDKNGQFLVNHDVVGVFGYLNSYISKST